MRAFSIANGFVTTSGASAMMSHFKAMSVVSIVVSVGMVGPKGKLYDRQRDSRKASIESAVGPRNIADYDELKLVDQILWDGRVVR